MTETRYIHPNAVLDIADQSYFADIAVDLVDCFIRNEMRSAVSGHRLLFAPLDVASVRLTFPDEKSLVAFELSFAGPVTCEPPSAFEPRNHAPLVLESKAIVRSHIAQLQAEARRAKINTTEEELSAPNGRHEGD
ncbi:hypothetical protein [Brevundimonas diminuta]|uniref:hypothetical protein n=1 Tax=Brevundimonas diminuta TaxID=293 RepID=UPI001376B7E0|nr:hypothetical protein [Brevundimonas diminuta]